VAGLLALVIAAVALVRGGPDPAAAARKHDVVIAPFRVAGAGPSLAYLREGMVELLASRIADGRAERAVDPGAILAAWRASGNDSARDPSRYDAVQLATALGADRVVVGSVVGEPGRLVLSASFVHVPDGQVGAQATVEGPVDSLSSLVDRLAARLLTDAAGESERLERLATPPLPAVRAYLDGRRAARVGDYAEALEHYERALRADTTFALAAFQLALAADHQNDAEQHDRALALAWAARASLSERDQAHLRAFAGPRYPAPSSEAEQLAAWEHAAALAPDRADVLHELGERFFHRGGAFGHDQSLERASRAFRRALELDPDYTPSRRLLLLATARSRDTAALARLATPALLADTSDELAPFLRWRIALARHDAAALRRAREEFPRLTTAGLRSVGMASLFDGVGLADAEYAMRLRRDGARRVAEKVDALLAQHAFAMNGGRPTLALELTGQLQEFHPGSRAHLRLRVLDALYGEGDTIAALAAVNALAPLVDASDAAPGPGTQLADLCVVEQWRLSRGETAGAARTARRLRTGEPWRETVPIAAAPIACAEILEVTLAVQARQRDALARVRRLDSLVLSGPALSDAGTYAHIVVARLYERLGQPREALSAIRRRTYMTGWPRYLATARREEMQLAVKLDEREPARAMLARYLALRPMPEPGPAAADAALRALVMATTRD
jgi:serine/threonine-protein kinase